MPQNYQTCDYQDTGIGYGPEIVQNVQNSNPKEFDRHCWNWDSAHVVRTWGLDHVVHHAGVPPAPILAMS